VFNGITITTLVYISFCMALYFIGARSAVAKSDDARRRRFKSQVLNTFIWGLFLVYPQVSSTTLLIFACSNLEDNTAWLMADYRIQCWTTQHKLYVGVGVFWTLLLPFGIPAAFVYVLWRSKVPQLATWKRDCAWLRAIAQRAMVLGVDAHCTFDPDTLTLESISLSHLRLLHNLFVHDCVDADNNSRADAATHGSISKRHSHFSNRNLTLADTLKRSLSLIRAQPLDGKDDEGEAGADDGGGGGEIVTHHAPGVGRASLDADRAAPGAGGDGRGSASGVSASRLSSLKNTMRRVRSAVSAAKSPRARLMAVFAKVRVQLKVTAAMNQRQLRRSLSTLFYTNERELLVMQLLEWARHDKTTLVAEPRDNMLRWRTQYEWDALRAEDAKLSERDTAERAAFFKFRFLFASYAVHAWYWESIDMFQKLFLTGIIAFIAPHTAVQVIVATLFALGMVLFTTRIKPYRERANNQLVALSQINLHLFLFTGLLLQTNPEGISENRLLFAVVVGALTTSIVVFTGFLFLRELSRQLLNTLIDIQDEERDDDESAAESDEEAGNELVAHGGHHGGHGSDDDHPLGMMGQRTVWDEAGDEGGGDRAGAMPRSASPGGTPPPPQWVSRLASRDGPR
jgi:hypothetical protein